MEHREKGRLNALLATLAEGSTMGDHYAALEELQVLAEEHMANEEKDGGLLDQLQNMQPNAQHSISVLQYDHQQLRAELAELVGQARALRDREQAFSARISEHEKAECELMNSLPYTDLGGGD